MLLITVFNGASVTFTVINPQFQIALMMLAKINKTITPPHFT